VLLADDHRMMREGLCALLREYPEYEVVGEVSNGREAVVQTRALLPDVVVMDLGMKELNGVEATRKIRHECPDVRVVVLSTYSDESFVLNALEAGASAYVLKIGAHEELVEAIRAVESGHRFLSTEITGSLVRAAVEGTPQPRDPTRTPRTPREREVLQLVAEGHASKEIATRLHLSVRTVEQHRRRVSEKLDAHGVADLTRWAIREGLVSLEE
jgi:DNA-binding NarL/FixJ family response regulator